MYCFLHFGFVNVDVFVTNSCSLYPKFDGARIMQKFVSDHLDQYVLTYNQLLTQFVEVIGAISVVQLSVVYVFSKKRRDSLVFCQSLKRLRLNQKSLEHSLIKSRFSAYCLISASKNYSIKGLRFHPCTATSIDYFFRLLKITGYRECHLFFKLIKHVFLLTGTFILITCSSF